MLVAVLAGAVYVTALPNGFARDDVTIVEQRDLVRRGAVTEALSAPWWPATAEQEGTLYRPVTLAFFAAQWRAFDGHPAGYHAVGVLLHMVASLSVLLLLTHVLPLRGAAGGATVFAVHPVHVEAVANVVGQAEILSTIAATLAAVLYLRAARMRPGAGRALAWVALAALYLLALGSKEIAVSLPALLVLLSAASVSADGRDGSSMPRGLAARLRDESPLFLLLLAVLAAYLSVRVDVLGSLRGELPAPELVGLSGVERAYTSMSVWPEYARLLLLPLEVSADYGPAVLFPARTLDAGVVLGALTLAAVVATAVVSLRRSPLVGIGLGWLVVSLLPVSNLLFPTGIVLAERTLYLPSIGLALLAGCAVTVGSARVGPPRVAAAVVLIVAAFATRTALRNPVWESSDTVVASLEADQPRSHVVLHARGVEAFNAGRIPEAEELFSQSLELLPFHYGHLVEVAQVKAVLGKWDEAQDLFARAVRLRPTAAQAHELWATRLLAAGLPAAGRRVAVRGLAFVDPPTRLWALVAATWEAEGRSEEARRARAAAGPPD